MIRLCLLGGIELRDSYGVEVRPVLSQPKRLALLAYLAVATGAPHRRDRLLGLFWPELDEDRARHALSKGIHFLRQSLGVEAILTRNTDEVAVDPAVVWCDATAFREAIRGDRLEEALDHYHDDLLPSFYIPQARGFEEWLDQERTWLRTQAARAAQVLAGRLAEAQKHTGAVDKARLALKLSDGDEHTLRRVVSLLHRLGDRADAIRAYERFKDRLEQEVGGKPSAETIALIEQIRRTAPSGPATAGDPRITAPPPPTPVGALDRFTHAVAGRYQVEGTIGSGGSAMVLLATDTKHQRRVAIKLLRPELTEPESTERFRSEILIAAAINHPHVVPLLDSGESEGFLYYVMPWHSGESLRDRLAREAPLAIGDALRIARDVADGLTAAHDRGIIHRDIKPENILLGADHAVLADFGIARSIEERPGITPVWTSGNSGTPAYVAPEQARGNKEVDGRCDVYALGCVLYEMLTGRAPFESDTIEGLLAHHQFSIPIPVRRLRPDTPAAIAGLVERALAKQPHDRPGGARELLNALTPEVRAARSPAWRWVAAGAAVALIGTLTAWWLIIPAPPPPDGRPQLVLADVDLGADSTDSPGLTLALRVHLTGSDYYQVVPPQRMANVLQRMALPRNTSVDEATAREIAFREGIPMVASVSIRTVRGRFVMVGRITDSEGNELGVTQFTAGPGEDSLIIGVGEISGRLRRIAGDRSREAENRPPLPYVTTSSLEALRSYAQAVAQANQGGGGVDQIALLERAIALDSGFATAYRLLSIRYVQARRFTAGHHAFETAMRHKDRMTEVERGLLEATAATQTGWADTAAQRIALDRVIARDPQNWTALANRGAYETWMQVAERGGVFADRALAVDSVHQGGWLVRFWVRLGMHDTAGATEALRDGTRVNGRVEPFLHEWAIYGWRTGDYSVVERLLDSLRRLPNGRDPKREDLAIIGQSVAFLRGRHRQAEASWREFAMHLPAERRDQVLASIVFREAQCGVTSGLPAASLARTLGPKVAAFDLRRLEPDERRGTANYLAGAWGWIGATDQIRRVYSIDAAPDSLLAPFVVHRREFTRLIGLLGVGRDTEVIARAHLHNNSPQNGELELPLALAFDRAGQPDSVIAAGERFLMRRTFIALTADMSCAEQTLRQRMGEIYEDMGDTANALRHYRHFVKTWEDPDPELRPRVASVARRIAALARPRTDR